MFETPQCTTQADSPRPAQTQVHLGDQPSAKRTLPPAAFDVRAVVEKSPPLSDTNLIVIFHPVPKIYAKEHMDGHVEVHVAAPCGAGALHRAKMYVRSWLSRGKWHEITGDTLMWKTMPSCWNDPTRLNYFAIHELEKHRAQYPKFLDIIAHWASEDKHYYLAKDLPWRSMVEVVQHYMDQGCTRACMMYPPTAITMKQYLETWAEENNHVRQLLNWEVWQPKDFCSVCRAGSWLADCYSTAFGVRVGEHKANIEFKPVSNKFYSELGNEMGLTKNAIWVSSPNNVGNLLEHLCLVAWEECRFEWIHCMELLRLSRESPKVGEALAWTAQEFQEWLRTNQKAEWTRQQAKDKGKVWVCQSLGASSRGEARVPALASPPPAYTPTTAQSQPMHAAEDSHPGVYQNFEMSTPHWPMLPITCAILPQYTPAIPQPPGWSPGPMMLREPQQLLMMYSPAPTFTTRPPPAPMAYPIHPPLRDTRMPAPPEPPGQLHPDMAAQEGTVAASPRSSTHGYGHKQEVNSAQAVSPSEAPPMMTPPAVEAPPKAPPKDEETQRSIVGTMPFFVLFAIPMSYWGAQSHSVCSLVEDPGKWIDVHRDSGGQVKNLPG